MEVRSACRLWKSKVKSRIILLTPVSEAGSQRETLVLQALGRNFPGAQIESNDCRWPKGGVRRGDRHRRYVEALAEALATAHLVVVLPRLDGTIGRGTWTDLHAASAHSGSIFVVRPDGRMLPLVDSGLERLEPGVGAHYGRFTWNPAPLPGSLTEFGGSA
jgi:hypothetical protein